MVEQRNALETYPGLFAGDLGASSLVQFLALFDVRLDVRDVFLITRDPLPLGGGRRGR